MRKVVYGGAVSLDMYLAREDGAVDWLIFDAEAMELMQGMWDRFDVMVMGRKTWEVAVASMDAAAESTTPSAEAAATPPVQEGSPGADDPGMPSYVFSRTVEPGRRGAYAVINNDPAEFVRELKSQPGKDILVMGGGEIGSLLLEAGLVDEVGFNIHPVLLGSGVPALRPMSRELRLELFESKVMKNGCVFVNYRVLQ